MGSRPREEWKALLVSKPKLLRVLSVPELFGTSGIRGDLERVSPELAFNLGLAVATFLKNQGSVAIGHDIRTSSPYLKHALASGLMAGGCRAVHFGPVPTPVLAFGTRENELNSGVIITGSHNPATDNGLKCYSAEGREYTGEEEENLERLILNRASRLMTWDRIGSAIEYDHVLDQYVRAVLREIKPVEKHLHVVVDCANSVAANITPGLLSSLGCKVTTINANLDGTFPGRSPEPTPETLIELQRLVSELKADLGIAHDSDADRVSIIDEKGRYVTNDRLLAFFAKILLQRHGPGKIVTSVDTSPRIDEVAQRYGGHVERTRLGRTHEAIVANREDLVLCCEPWKIIDVHWGFWGDGIYAACVLASQLSEAQLTLSKLLEDIPDYPQKRIAIPCPDQAKGPAMNIVKARLAEEKNVKEVWQYDGVRVNYMDGSYVLLRPSGTEPRMRIYCEARSQTRLDELVDRCTSLVKAATKTQ